MQKLSKAQRRFLSLLAGDPPPKIFLWASKVDGRIVKLTGGPENWTHFRITARVRDGRRIKYKTATLTAEDFGHLRDCGFTQARDITAAGRAALEDGK